MQYNKSSYFFQLFKNIESDDVSAFLPPGYNPDAAKEEDSKPVETTTKETTTTTKKSDFKLDLSNLFSDIKTDEVSAFLPPGYKAEEQQPETTTEAKSSLKFPTRPGSVKKVDKPSSSRPRPSGPPPFVPKIKSFADR